MVLFYFPIIFVLFNVIYKRYPRLKEFFTLFLFLIQATVVHWLFNLYFKISRQKETAAPRPGDKEISASWLNQLLHEKNLIKETTKVKKVEINPLSNHRGLCSVINVVKIAYENDESDSEAPKTLILKTNTLDNLSSRFTNIAIGRHREAYFYERFKGATKCVPNVLFTYGSPFTGNYLILMENLGNNSTGVNFYFGNQIWGTKELEQPREQEEMLKDIYLKAAEMHATFWNDRSLLEKSWLKSVDWYNGKGKERWTIGCEGAKRFWLRAKKEQMNKTTPDAVKWSPKLVSIIDKSFENSTWERVQEQLKDPKIPFTLVHGDFHASNMLYKLSGEDRVVWVDWSEIGVWEPMTDIGQIVISDVKPEIRRKHEKELVRAYWEHLVSHGVSPQKYTFEECYKMYGIGPIERWIWLFALLTGFNIPPKAIQYFHDQLLAFIEDHSDQPYYILRPIACIV